VYCVCIHVCMYLCTYMYTWLYRFMYTIHVYLIIYAGDVCRFIELYSLYIAFTFQYMAYLC